MAKGRGETAVGLQIHKEYAQITWYDTTVKEPCTCGAGDGEEPELIPVPEKVRVIFADSLQEPETDLLDALKQFLEQVLERIPGERSGDMLRVMVTVPHLTVSMQTMLPEALGQLGLERRNIYLQDYFSSFYYYTINQKKELWNGDVALLEYHEPDMIGYVLHTDHGKNPALVTVKEAARMTVDPRLLAGRDPEWVDREKDRLLFELLKKLFERRNVVTSYLVGDYYDGSWAVRSFQYLCQRRHAFRGGNLYTMGACFAAMTRCGMLKKSDLLFLGTDMISENIGMNMRINGKEGYYPVVSAGINWYEAHHECEFIPDHEDRITLVTKPMDGGEEVAHVLHLNSFPKRPNRATRLRMTVFFTSADICNVEVEDLGFGGLYAPSGMCWKRKIRMEGRT